MQDEALQSQKAKNNSINRVVYPSFSNVKI